jgi:hypothetical protein
MTASAGKLLQIMTAPHDNADTLLVGKSGGRGWERLGGAWANEDNKIRPIKLQQHCL